MEIKVNMSLIASVGSERNITYFFFNTAPWQDFFLVSREKVHFFSLKGCNFFQQPF